jgi:hypothetical protein
MSEQIQNPFDLLVDQIRTVVRQEIAAASNEKTVKLLYTTKEAAEMLGLVRFKDGVKRVDESWLANKARAGLVPCRMLGHYRYFSMADIEAIISQSAVNGERLTPQAACDGVKASHKGGANNGKKEKPSQGVSLQDRPQGRQG